MIIVGGVVRDDNLGFRKAVYNGLEAKMAMRAKGLLVNCNISGRVSQAYFDGY